MRTYPCMLGLIPWMQIKPHMWWFLALSSVPALCLDNDTAILLMITIITTAKSCNQTFHTMTFATIWPRSRFYHWETIEKKGLTPAFKEITRIGRIAEKLYLISLGKRWISKCMRAANDVLMSAFVTKDTLILIPGATKSLSMCLYVIHDYPGIKLGGCTYVW